MEGAFAGQHFIENGSEAKDVGAIIDGLAAHLLGRHIAGGADDHAGIGTVGDRRGIAIGFSLTMDQFGQSEVQNFDAAVFGEEEILRLEIAVNDALVVRSGESMRDLNSVIDGFASRKWAALQGLPQRFADEQFGDEVRRALEDSELVDGEDVGMIESCSGLSLLLEAQQTLGIARNK